MLIEADAPGWPGDALTQQLGSPNQASSARTSVSRLSRGNAPVTVIHVGVERASYAPFRDTFFYDPSVNPRLKGDGGETDHRSLARDSKRLWTSNGPRINTRAPKTATCPGSAFKNQSLSADRLYSTNRNSLGYEVHRSLRGTSLCSTTKRFEEKTKTPDAVGPGSYDVSVHRTRPIHQPPPPEPPKTAAIVLPSGRLKQWGGKPDDREMGATDEWKITSEKPSPTTYSFQRAKQKTWIEQIEEHQRRTNPQVRPLPSLAPHHTTKPEQRLPDFLQGCRNPISTKAGAVIAMLDASSGEKDDAAPPCASSADLHFSQQTLEAIKPLIPEALSPLDNSNPEP